MRLLVANPNTSVGVTEICARAARAVAAPGTEILPLTGAFGAEVISSRAELAVAEHALLDGLAAHHQGADAVLLAVSYDTALLAAREMLPIPVVGMTEAAMLAACLLATRFALVTFGTPQIYRELVAARGLSDRLAGIGVAVASPAQAYAEPELVDAAVLDAAQRVVAETGAEAVVLCGAAMAGMPARIAAQLPVPALDGITCGVPLCEMLVRNNVQKARIGSLVPPGNRGTVGLSAALAALLRAPAGGQGA